MSEIERPGIYRRWEGAWKENCKNLLEWQATCLPMAVGRLEHYVQHGTVEATAAPLQPALPPPGRSVPFRSWEKLKLRNSLSMRAALYVFDLEQQAMSGGSFDSNIALRAFASACTSELIEIRLRCLSSEQSPFSMDYAKIPYTALGVIIGCDKQAFRLARLQIAGYRKRWYHTRQFYPIFHFMIRLLGDYLGESTISLEGESLTNPIFNTLSAKWRDPNPDNLTHACLAACDFHTHRCRQARSDNFHEFDNGAFTRIPIETFLLFRLRQLLGLANPALDHPLMNSALGRMPDKIEFDSLGTGADTLVHQVRERMMNDGYDESAILNECR